MSLYVNLSTGGSIGSNDACDIRNPAEDVESPIAGSWSPDNGLPSTDTLGASPDGASSIVPHLALLARLDNSANDMPAGQSETSSWGLNQFMAHHERIDDICMGSNSRAAEKAHTHNLLAQLDDILTILYPAASSMLSRIEAEAPPNAITERSGQ